MTFRTLKPARIIMRIADRIATAAYINGLTWRVALGDFFLAACFLPGFR